MKNELKKWVNPCIELVSFDADDIIATSLVTPAKVEWEGDMNEDWELRSNVKHDINE